MVKKTKKEILAEARERADKKLDEAKASSEAGAKGGQEVVSEKPSDAKDPKRGEPSGSSRRSSDNEEEDDEEQKVPKKPSMINILGNAIITGYLEAQSSPEVIAYRTKQEKEKAKQEKAKKKAKKAALEVKNKRKEHTATLGPIRGRIWYWLGGPTP